MLNVFLISKSLILVAALPLALCLPAMLSTTTAGAAPTKQSPVNIVQNGDFRAWASGAPVGWSLGEGAKYEPDTQMSYATSQSLKAVQVPSDATLPSVRIYQDVALHPHARYRLSLAMAKHGTGAVAIRVQPLVNGAIPGNVAAPLNWSNVWSWYFPWQPLTLEFETGAQSDYRVTIQSYGKTGEPVWIENVAVTPAQANNRQSEANTAGFKLYSQSIMQPFEPDTAPLAPLPVTELFASGTRGDFSPAFIGLQAGEALRGVQLAVSKAPTSPQGAVIPAENIAIRMIAPQALLPLSRPRQVDAGQNLGWHVTARIPENLAPGTYTGQLTLAVEGQAATPIPYTIRVEDFLLPQPDIPLFVYHSEDYFPSGNFLTAQLREAYYRDMKDHGMNTVTIYNNPDIDGTEIDFNRDYRHVLSGKNLEDKKKKRNLTDQDLLERSQFGLNQTLALAQKSGLLSSGHPLLWLVTKQNQYNWGAMPGPALQKALQQWNSRTDWPEPLLYVLDEPDGHPDRIAAARKVLDNIKQLNIPVKTVTAGVAIEELGKDYDIWIQAESSTTAHTAEQARRHNAQLWTYNCNMPTDNTQFTRAFYGFWAYRSQVKGIGLWAYYDAGNWYTDENGQVHGKNGPANLSRICPSPTGPIPTLSWETTREGIVDYRYALLYDQLLAQLEAKIGRLETEAQKVLDANAIGALKAEFAARKSPPSARPQPWKAASAEENQAANLYRQAQALGETLGMARKIRTKIIESIPTDAMTIMKGIPWSAENGKFVPTLDSGDPLLASEHKRNSLRAYIRYLRATLQA